MIIIVLYADSGGQQDGRMRRGDDSSNNSEDGVDSNSVHFYLGTGSGTQTSISSNNNTPVNATAAKYTLKKDMTPTNHHPTVSSSAVAPSTYSHLYQQHHQQSHVVGPHDR